MTGIHTPVRTHFSSPPAATDPWVPRFGLTERFAHWWTVLMVASALITGLALGGEAESGPTLTLHIASVIAIGVGLLGAAVFGNTRVLLRAARRLFTFDRRDVAWIRSRARHPFSRHVDAEWGMFNTGQKILSWAVSISLVVVIVTGIQSWNAGGEGSGAHGAAVVVCMVLLAAHVFMATVNPATRPALAGMVLGRVRRGWAARHHGAWLKEQ